jgi:glycosyltransferase involved in cell wall biosynthesis
MRIGAAWDISMGRQYRAVDPMLAMARRGHEIAWPDSGRGDAVYPRLRRCDVVHVYRRSDPPTLKVLAQLAKDGVPFVFDNDDNQVVVPKGSMNYEAVGGLRAQRVFSFSLRAAKLASLMTTTAPSLADVYRRAGVAEVRVIPNQLRPNVPRPTRAHDGLVIGWVAGGEHAADAGELGIGEALGTVLERHENVTVELFGIDLKLHSPRYRRVNHVPFEDLPVRIGGWDIGIAPLADLPFNRTRSDIKVKEYAGSGVPWLASPVRPYADLGERQGGLLVRDGEWLDALERLITNDRLRRKLSKRARKWAKGQTIDAVADDWERALMDAAAARLAA